MLIPAHKNETVRFVAFDIETAPMAGDILEPLVPAFDPSEVKVGNLKDPALVAAKIEAAAEKHKSQFFRDAALSALTGQVAALGLVVWFPGKVEAPEATELLVAPATPVTVETEATILTGFWEAWTEGGRGTRTIWVGHNILDFDLPFLVLRSRILGVKVPSDIVRYSGSKYYFSSRFVDTRNLYAMGRNVRDLKTSLDHICGLMGLGRKTGSGADFADLVNRDNAAARAYLKTDIELTAKLAVRLGVEEIHGLPND